MTETAVSRLVAATDPWAPGAQPDTIQLARSDAQALAKLVADLCPTHGACEECETDLCQECGLGEFLDCGHTDRILCVNCWETCRICRDQDAADQAADTAWDCALEGAWS